MGRIVITNVVASTNLATEIDLRAFAKENANVVKNSKMQNLVWRHKRIKATALLFRNGYISVHGSKTIKTARKAIRQFARLLWRKGYNPILQQIKINTMSAVYRLNVRKIDLMTLYSYNNVWYEPELFSAAVISSNGIKCLLYSSGTLVMTGIKPGQKGNVRRAISQIKSYVNA